MHLKKWSSVINSINSYGSWFAGGGGGWGGDGGGGDGGGGGGDGAQYQNLHTLWSINIYVHNKICTIISWCVCHCQSL
jgi:hypothetical protein